MKEAIGSFLLFAFVVILITLGIFLSIKGAAKALSQQSAVEAHKAAVQRTAAFRQADFPCKDFILKKGTAFKVRSEVGTLLIVLPEEGEVAILTDKDE